MALLQSDAGEPMAMEPRQNAGQQHVGKVSSAVEARQGVISGRIFLVLVTSLVLAVVAIVVAYFVVR